MAHPSGNNRRGVFVADGRSEDGESLELSESEYAPANMPMMFTLAAHDECSARGRLFLGSGELNAFANHDPHRTLVGTGHSGDVTEELSLLHSRELLTRAVWAAGLNVTLETAPGHVPCEIVVKRAELCDAAASAQLFEIRFASATEFVVVRDDVMMGSGSLGHELDSEALRLLIDSRPTAAPQPGATYQLRVSSLQETIERVLRTLRIQIRADGASVQEARTVELSFRDDVPHRAAAFLRELVVGYAERRQGAGRTSAFKPPLLTNGTWSGVLPPPGYSWGSSERTGAQARDAFGAERPRWSRPAGRRISTLNLCLGVLVLALAAVAIKGAIDGPSDAPRPAPSVAGATPTTAPAATPSLAIGVHPPPPPPTTSAQPRPSSPPLEVTRAAAAPDAPAADALEPASPRTVDVNAPIAPRRESSAGAAKKRRAVRRAPSTATTRQSEPPASAYKGALPLNPY